MREWIKLVETMVAGHQHDGHDGPHAQHAEGYGRGSIYVCPHCASRMPMDHLADRCPVCHQATDASGVSEAVAPSTPAPASLTAPAPLRGGARVSERPYDADQRRAFGRLQELANFKPKMPVKPAKRPMRKAI